MIEDEVREAFTRHEDRMPDLSALRKAIDRAAAKRRRRRYLGVPAGAAALLVLVTLLVIPAVLDRADDRSTASALAGPPDGLNVLLLGLDEHGLADNVTLVHVSRDNASIQLVSLPRDLRVDLPGGGYTKLNAAAPEQVAELTGLHFEATIAVKLSSVAAIVDGLGGVDVCLPDTVPSMHRPGVAYLKGCRHYTGQEAADLMRQRKGLAMGALERDRNVQRIMIALWAKAATAEPARLARLATTAGITLDAGLWEFAIGLRGIDPSNVVGLGQPDFHADGIYVRLAPEAGELFRALREDTVDTFTTAHPEWVTPMRQSNQR